MIEPKEINYIDLDLMEKMCHPIAVALFDSNSEPMSKFKDNDDALPDSSLNNAKQNYYSVFFKKAAVLYYSIIKNHPFKNGNKRIATASLLVFLFINIFWISRSDKETEDYLVNLAKRVAESKGSDKRENFLNEIETWLEKNILSY